MSRSRKTQQQKDDFTLLTTFQTHKLTDIVTVPGEGDCSAAVPTQTETFTDGNSHYWHLEPIPDVAKESKIRNCGLFSFNLSVFGLHSKVKATAGSSSEG